MPPLCNATTAAATVASAAVLLLCSGARGSFALAPHTRSHTRSHPPRRPFAPPPKSLAPSATGGATGWRTALSASPSSSDAATTTTTGDVIPTGGQRTGMSRSERKALARTKKERKKRRDSDMRPRSDHPEAVAKARLASAAAAANPALGGTGTAHHPAMPLGGNHNGHRRHNYADRENALSDDELYDGDEGGEHEFPLHSNAVAVLNSTSTADDVVRAIKRAQNLHDVHDILAIERFLIEEVDEHFAYGYRGSLLSRLAVAALHMHRPDLAVTALTVRRSDHADSALPHESAAIVRGLLRVHDVDRAREVLEDELALPTPRETEGDAGGGDEFSSEDRDRIVHRARILGSVASRFFYEGEPAEGMDACRTLADMGGAVAGAGLTAKEVGMPWERIVRGAALCESMRREKGETDWGAKKRKREGRKKEEGGTNDEGGWPCNLVYSVLDAMMTFPSSNDDQTFESLCNALVRRTVFVTGAVDLSGCPEEDRGEVAFIGRSNVGKSSLVNMLTNRKSLAYTSKTPGKTQQFNFFAVNDKPDRDREIRFGDVVRGEKDRDSFYIVDLPGFGFARAPQKQRQLWADFMEDYLANRSTLRVVFHLIDARHGPTEEDAKIMQKVGDILPKNNRVQYVVVLTKADKNSKGASTSKNPGRVPKKIREKLDDAMRANRVGYAPVVLTSAETRLGRDEVWKYLRLAAEM